MPLPPVERNYRMTDDALAMLANNIVDYMTRDLAKFEEWGIDAADIAALQSKQNAFEQFPQDVTLRAEVTEAVEAKDFSREDLTKSIKEIADRVAVKWGDNSPKYKGLGASNMTSQKDSKLIFTARTVRIFATEHLLEMADVGLTQAMIDDLTSKVNDFEEKVREIEVKTALRDEKSRERIVLGNELYFLVAKYCDFGKRIWDDVNESFYNDYIIYKKPVHLPSKVQNLQFDIANIKLKWDIAAGADTYQLEIKQNLPGFDWLTLYEGAANEFIYSPGGGSWYFRCRGKNENGSGTWSEELLVEQPT